MISFTQPIMTSNPNNVDRFWSRVQRRAEGCWLWTHGASRGYGRYFFGGRTWRAHRLAWVISGLSLADEDILCHRCDVPLCVRPDHLFIGTQADNRADCVRKGRHARGDAFRSRPSARGEANGGGTRLLAVDVLEIRKLLLTDMSKNAIGRMFGVSGTMIGYIAKGRQWGHIR